MFNNIRADLHAHGGNWSAQGFWARLVYRFGRWRYTIASRWLRKPFSWLYKILYKLVQILASIKLPCEVEVGLKNTREPCAPQIGNNVDIGDNAVVTCNVPTNTLEVGELAVLKPILNNG